MRFDFTTSYITLWLVALLLGIAAFAILGHIVELRRLVSLAGPQDRSSLPVGVAAPKFTGKDMRSGREIGSAAFAGSMNLLVFVSPGCSACSAVVDYLSRGAPDDWPRSVVVCNDDDRKCRALLSRLPIHVPILVDSTGEIMMRYRVWGPPGAVVVDPSMRVLGSGHPSSASELEALVRHAVPAWRQTSESAGGPLTAAESPVSIK